MALNRSQARRTDPTGQARRRRVATSDLRGRLTVAEMRIHPIIRAFTFRRRFVTPIVNRTEVFYDYDLSPGQLNALSIEIRQILNEEFDVLDDQPPPLWFWVNRLESPYRQGTVEETNRFNRILGLAISAGLITDPFVRQVPIEQVQLSTPYQKKFREIVGRNYATIKSLSETTSVQVMREIRNGVTSGASPRQISTTISERFEVSESRAKVIADTEINRAYNDAKINSARTLSETTNQRTALLHISALLPTTRESHAIRHGNAYTPEDQERWWDQGANRINCKCSTAIALVDQDGNIMQTEDQETLKRERQFFER